MSKDSPRLETALDYARRGWRVFPLIPFRKEPQVKDWVNVATTDLAVITQWWQQTPNANIGIATGGGLLVLDVDCSPGKVGADSLYDLEQQCGELPETRMVQSWTGGWHYHFSVPGEYRNTAGKLGPDIDTRCDGGYIVAPPSVINGDLYPDKQTPGQRAYTWEVEHGLDFPVAPAPAWLLALLTAASKETPRQQQTPDSIPEGQRNSTLTSLAGTMQRRGMTPDAILAAIQAENSARCNPPLPDGEVRQIAASVGRYAPGGADYAGDAAAGWETPAGGPARPADDAYPDPAPLPDLRQPVPPFDPDLLPERLRYWLMDIAERMQCPLEYPAVAATVALSSLVGRQLGIRPKRRDDWLVVPNLWGCIVGRPGLMKTNASDEALKPLHRLQHAASEAYEAALADYEGQAMTHESLVQAAKKTMQQEAKKRLTNSRGDWREARAGLSGEAEQFKALEADAPPQPTMRRYITSDPTPEKLGEILKENPTGTLLHRDELAAFLKGMDREGREESRGFFLQGWNGTGCYIFDRIGRGTTHIPAVCISLLGNIQPGPLSDYVYQATHGGAGNDGLLQRFQLMVWPDDIPTWRNVDRWPNQEAKQIANDVYNRLNTLNVNALGAERDDPADIPFLRFSPEAQGMFDEWRLELETTKLRSGEPEALESHLAKYRSLAPSLALLFHLIDGGTGPVGGRAAARAFDWCEFLEAHARRVYGAGTIPGLEAAHALVAKIQGGRLPEMFTAREVYLKGWSRLTDPEEVEAAIKVLADLDWVSVRPAPPGPQGGRPTQRYIINPKLRAPHEPA